jgi:hemolysin III
MSVLSIDLSPPRRQYSDREIRLDACIHALGLVGALVCSASLIGLTAARDPGKVGAICVYALCLVAMFTASAAYNVGYSSRYRALFRRCDHSAIFLLIAGTYTPFTVHLHVGLSSTLLTGAIWFCAGAGIAMKLHAPMLFEKYSDAIYLGLGWAGIPVILPIAAGIPGASLAMIMAGGVLYSIGVIFHRWEKLAFHNAIWHVFVLAAAACHYESILTGVALSR